MEVSCGDSTLLLYFHVNNSRILTNFLRGFKNVSGWRGQSTRGVKKKNFFKPSNFIDLNAWKIITEMYFIVLILDVLPTSAFHFHFYSKEAFKSLQFSLYLLLVSKIFFVYLPKLNPPQIQISVVFGLLLLFLLSDKEEVKLWKQSIVEQEDRAPSFIPTQRNEEKEELIQFHNNSCLWLEGRNSSMPLIIIF